MAQGTLKPGLFKHIGNTTWRFKKDEIVIYTSSTEEITLLIRPFLELCLTSFKSLVWSFPQFWNLSLMFCNSLLYHKNLNPSIICYSIIKLANFESFDNLLISSKIFLQCKSWKSFICFMELKLLVLIQWLVAVIYKFQSLCSLWQFVRCD